MKIILNIFQVIFKYHKTKIILSNKFKSPKPKINMKIENLIKSN